MFENVKVFESLFLRQGQEGFLEFRFLFFFMVHITAADTCDGTVLRSKLFADFKHFFLIHIIYTPLSETSPILAYLGQFYKNPVGTWKTAHIIMNFLYIIL